MKSLQVDEGCTVFGDPYHLVGEEVFMDSLELHEFEGIVIAIDFVVEA